MYKLNSKIRYSEIDYKGNLALGSLVDYFQDASTFQTEESDLGPLYFQNANKAWIINAWQIDILRYPKLGERVNVGTWPYNFKRFIGERNYIMETEDGELLARANSVWALYDMKKFFPATLTEDEVKRYGVEPPLDMVYKPRKIKCDENWTFVESFEIGRDRIDTKQSVMLGQKVEASIIDQGNLFYVRFQSEAGDVYAIHEFGFGEDLC